MLLPWQKRGSTKVAWGWVSPRMHHTSACHWHSWAHLHWLHGLSAGLSPSPCPYIFCCEQLFVKRKSNLMYPFPILISLFHLTFLSFFLQPGRPFHAVPGLAVSLFLHPPPWAHGRGGCMLDGGWSSHEWLPCHHTLGKSEAETWAPGVEATN